MTRRVTRCLRSPRKPGLEGAKYPESNGIERLRPLVDATSVGADLVVETWICHGPRSGDPTFDPSPGDSLIVCDDEEPPCRARVIRREGSRVWTQLDLGFFANVGGGALL